MSTIFVEYHHEIETGPNAGERTLRFEVWATPVVPAKIWGPPENCHPEEGGDFEVYDVECVTTGQVMDMEQCEVRIQSPSLQNPGKMRVDVRDGVRVRWADGEVAEIDLWTLEECADEQAEEEYDPDPY